MEPNKLLEYITQNIKAGYPVADIERALLAEGWSAPDVSAALAQAQHLPTPLPTVPQPAAVVNNEAETLRIKRELELEAKKGSQRGYVATPTSEGGIIGWLVTNKIVRDSSQANLVLYALLGVIILAIVWVNFPTFASKPTSGGKARPLQPPTNIKP